MGAEILRVTFLEHQRDAFAHYADGVDSVYHRLHFGFEQAALSEDDHVQKYQLGRTTISKDRLRFLSSACNCASAAGR
jgi:hypothetical protein